MRPQQLARSIRRAVASAENEHSPLTAVVPVDKAAILEARPALLALADDLEEIRDPDPRGIELTLELLRDGSGPLYRPWRPEELRGAAERARRAL